MRQPRFTYAGAFHHCMNHGIGKEPIMAGEANKTAFMELLAQKVVQYRMRLLAYALMDTHYHVILQNASGRMSDFFRSLNTHYAFHYRAQEGGKGYVFQDRFVSTLIQDESYLRQAILYLLLNPVRAGMAGSWKRCSWTSAAAYFAKEPPAWLDAEFVLQSFGGAAGLEQALQGDADEDLPVLRTRLGPVLGDESFVEKALARFERRSRSDAVKKRRHDDYDYDPEEKVIQEFEKFRGVRIEEINVGTLQGKRLRTELLVRLRDQAGLKFREIAELPVFADLQYLSMSRLYLNYRKRVALGE